MSSTDAAWAGIAGSAVALEAWAVRRGKGGPTLSALTRRVFRCDTTTGRVAFGAAWGAASVYVVGHIVFDRW